MKIEGKVALITGGARGIGRAYCEALLEKEAKGVAIADVKDDVGEETASQLCSKFGAGKTIFIKTDVTNESELRTAFQKTLEEFGSLDIVSCTAGITDEINYKRMIDINLTSVITGTYLAYEYMKERGGVIVNTASLAGLFAHSPIGSAYCATKFGVVGFTQSVSQTCAMKEVLGYGIRVNAVCPGAVDTALITEVRMQPHFADLFNEVLEKAKMKKMMMPADVAPAFIRLVEDDDLNGICVEVRQGEQRDHNPTFVTL